MDKQGNEAQNDLYWRDKYLQLETKMSQFHSQASEIRNKLAVKIATLTTECEAATERANIAEEELRLLRDRMMHEKERKDRISQLAEELKMEREMAKRNDESFKMEIEQRNEERALVHKKIIKLKLWISAKLEEVEDQKKLLFEANERATTSLYEMKRRVHELTTELNELKQSTHMTNNRNHSTTQEDISLDSSRASLSPLPNSHSMDVSMSPPPVPPHADKVIKRSTRRGGVNSPTKDSNTPFPLLPEDMAVANDSSSASTSETISHISSVDENKKASKSSPVSKRSDVAPEVVIDLEKGHGHPISPKLVIDGKKKKKSATLPKTRSVAKKEHSTPHHSSLIETFGSITRKFRGFADSHQHTPTRGLRRTQSAGKKEGKLVRTGSGSKKSPKHVSSPNIDKDLAKSRSSDHSKHCLSGGGTTSILPDTLEEEDEEKLSRPMDKMEIAGNSSAPASTYLSTSLPSPMLSSILPRTKRSQSMRTPRKRPPTPPLHQVPVWETKIYNLSKYGFQLRGSDVIRSTNQDSRISIRYHPSTQKTNLIYKRDKLDVPVYTKLFGKIILLRKTSFPTSSELSDDDGENPVTVATELRHLRTTTSYDSNYAIPLRRNGSPGQARAIKRANSCHSMTSSEGDYSVPPDAISLCSDSSEPEHKLYKTGRTGAPAAASSRVNSGSSASPENGTSPLLSPANLQQQSTLVQEKCGFLFKLGGYTLTWQKRWFVLKPNRLQYFRSPNDLNKKPLGEISLNNETNLDVQCNEDSRAIFCLYNEKKTVYISAESSYVADDWMRALNITLNRPRGPGLCKAGKYHSLTQNRMSLKGWLESSSKDGQRRRLWSCLGSSSLYFYVNEKEKEFVGRMVLKDCKVSPSEQENALCIKFPSHHGQQRANIFLFLSTKMEKDAWLYWLTVASGSLSLSLSGNQNSEACVGTAYERLITRIMYVAMCTSDNKDDSIPVGAASPLWRNQILTFSRDGTAQPLTTLSSEALHTEAVKLMKICQLFMNAEMDSASVDYHVTLAQRAASTCLTHQQLQGEIFAQLIKQCNGKFPKQIISTSPKHATKKPKTSTTTDDETAVLQVWKLLSLLIPLFIPHQRMLWLLKAHLQRHADDKSEIGQYAIYCQRGLARAFECGGRTSPPSRTETVSILLQNPFHHSLPFSIPVHFYNGKYEVVSFDASTTVGEFTQRACQQAGIRIPSVSGFVLSTDDPVDALNIEHLVSATSKICDIISEWERAYRDISTGKIVDASRMVKVTLSQHLSFVAARDGETEKERILISYQVSSNMASDRFPVTRELAIELAALYAQMDEGDMRTADQGFNQILEKFYPRRFLDNSSKQHLRQLRAKLCERWTVLKCTPGDCAKVFLAAVRKCPMYGAKIFQVEVCKKPRRTSAIYLAIHEDGVDELNHSTMETEHRFGYQDIATYGGYGDKLVIVVDTDGTVKKHSYCMPVEKAAEMVHMITEYMELSLTGKGFIDCS